MSAVTNVLLKTLSGRLLDLLAFTSYFFQVLFLSLPGFACNQPLQTYRVPLAANNSVVFQLG